MQCSPHAANKRPLLPRDLCAASRLHIQTASSNSCYGLTSIACVLPWANKILAWESPRATMHDQQVGRILDHQAASHFLHHASVCSHDSTRRLACMADSSDSPGGPRCILSESVVMVIVNTAEELVLPVVVGPLVPQQLGRRSDISRIIGVLTPCTLPPARGSQHRYFTSEERARR